LLTPQGYLREWGDDGKVHFKRWLDQDMLAHVDILILSTYDIAAAPELEQEFAQACEWVIVTDGDKGGTCYHRGIPSTYAAFPAVELEPTGAGDVFAASLLASLMQLKNDIPTALKVAARLSAISVTRRGAWQEFSTEEIHDALYLAQDKK